MEGRLQHLYEFGPFRLDTGERLLLRHGRRVTLTPKAFETLVALVERRGRLVEKDELIKTVWPDSFVEEGNLTNNISTLRKTLGQGQNGDIYIETVPKGGYRFIAQVKELPCATPELVLEKHTLTRIETEEEDETRPEYAKRGILSVAAAKQRRGQALLMVAGACLLVAAGVLGFDRLRLSRQAGKAGTAAPNTQLRSIAVLPFKTMGAENDNEYLSQGISETLITRLGDLRQLIVRPASAVRRYTDAGQDAVAAGREQGVDAVLDGSVQRAGDRIRVTVQLVRVQDRAVLWSGQFDEDLTDIFAVQDSISRQVAQGLMLKLSDEERGRLQKRGTENIEAYQAYLKGRYFWNRRTPEGYKKAVEYLKQATDIDPAYARAFAGLADALLYRGGNSLIEVREAQAKGRAALKKALAIDETLAEPHATLGLLAMNVDRNWTDAEKEYQRAIELNPNYATAHHWYGEFLAYMGRFDEGLAEITRAQELDPLSLIISTDVAKVYFMSRQYDRAIEQGKKTLEMDPNFAMAHVWLGFAYSFKGQHEQAISEFHQIKDLTNEPFWISYLGYVYGRAGQDEEAQKALKHLTALSKQTYVPPISMMMVYLGLGEKDEVFRWYGRVFDENAVGAIELKINPGFDDLRSDPRFANLLRRAGFAE